MRRRKRDDENMCMDLDEAGKLVSMTVEHARTNARLPEFSYREIEEQA